MEAAHGGPGPSRAATGAPSSTRKPTRVAIVGTGLAGLVAAFHLTNTPELRHQFEVHLFERGSELGLDAHSFTTDDGQRIDVPMRSVNAGVFLEADRRKEKPSVGLSDSSMFPLLTKSCDCHSTIIVH